MTAPVRVLFVCTGNSARSIIAEALLRARGGVAFDVHSAGTDPRGINPLTIRLLAELGLPADGLRSTSVTEYLDRQFDHVVTVCDDARQVCPVFPGTHASLHWSLEDPAAVAGTDEERMAAFRSVAASLSERIDAFVSVTRP